MIFGFGTVRDAAPMQNVVPIWASPRFGRDFDDAAADIGSCQIA